MKPVLAGSDPVELPDPKLKSFFFDVSLPKENDGAVGTTLADAADVADPLPNLKPVSAGLETGFVPAEKPVEAADAAAAPLLCILNLSFSSVRCFS